MLVTLFSVPTMCYAQVNDCLNNYNDELNLHDTLNSEIIQNITSMGLNPQDAEQYRKSLSNDPIGEQFDQTTKCLHFKWTSSNNDDPSPSTSITIITAVLTSIGGAALVIWGTEYLKNHNIRKNGKAAINSELKDVKKVLDNKVKYEDRGIVLEYAPYQLTTVAFDSVVSSGALLHFPIELQNVLNSLYFYIKGHNILLKELSDIMVKVEMEDVLPGTEEVILRYHGNITVYENVITKEFLGRAMNLLSS